jgi:hypothetical protein
MSLIPYLVPCITDVVEAEFVLLGAQSALLGMGSLSPFGQLTRTRGIFSGAMMT